MKQIFGGKGLRKGKLIGEGRGMALLSRASMALDILSKIEGHYKAKDREHLHGKWNASEWV